MKMLVVESGSATEDSTVTRDPLLNSTADCCCTLTYPPVKPFRAHAYISFLFIFPSSTFQSFFCTLTYPPVKPFRALLYLVFFFFPCFHICYFSMFFALFLIHPSSLLELHTTSCLSFSFQRFFDILIHKLNQCTLTYSSVKPFKATHPT